VGIDDHLGTNLQSPCTPTTQSWREAIVSIKSWLRSSEQPREALYGAGTGRHAEQDGPVHLFPGRKLREALGDGLGGNQYVDLGALILWHAGGMPEDGCSTVSGSRGPWRVRNG
jgi:hypothetical protein